jgi:hypothetical protein
MREKRQIHANLQILFGSTLPFQKVELIYLGRWRWTRLRDAL